MSGALSVRRALVLLLGLAVLALALVVLTEDDEPDFAGIRQCTLPSVVPPAHLAEDPTPRTGITLTAVAELDQPIVLVPWIDGERLLVGSRPGTMWLLDPETGDRTEVLDIADRLALNVEGGLIGAAISPDGGHVYLHYTDHDGASRIVELATTSEGLDASSERELLRQPHPGLVHNGGAMVFGPDDHLWFGFGDGGPGPEDVARVEDPDRLDGKLLRIDPRPSGSAPYSIPSDNPYVDGGGRPEIWASGLRNPYRFAFDPATDDLWVGDVGEACYEEINLVARTSGGLDFGFPRFEGRHEFLGGSTDEVTFPALVYEHGPGCAVIVGEVVRDPRLEEHSGKLLHSDLCSGGLHWVRSDGAGVSRGSFDVEVLGVLSFGTGPAGEVYVLTANEVLRVDPGG